ncbi:lycopene cyclase family protein [Nocardia suismassiliense]|uniref:lycopene cyclase family protein n=1 Tax=Nocardia suismassiliense TaxID=2077092 RepID=UPI000D1E42B6|nr:lycopene cyclase family protein [Nocardia suismassiliense]
MTVDVVVCGLGPAGRALAHRCLARGLSVTVVDPAPDRRWTATYAAWANELPGWLDASAIAATVDQPTAWGTREHRIERAYAVLDTDRLRESLDLTGAEVVADRAVELTAGTVSLASGRLLSAQRVIDARGIARSPALAEQTAYGLVLDAKRCAGLAPLFMDWRADNGAPEDAPRSFLYAVPLGGGGMLLEETCLAGRPALDGTVLRERLVHRLRSRGIDLTGAERVERVRFPVEGGRPGRGTFGAAGGFAHPATGYSVAASLAAADAVAAGAAIWPVSARAVYRLRAAGLRALLALPPTDLPVFFDAFFGLPTAAQRVYLSGRTDLNGMVSAMRTLFVALPPTQRRRVAAATLGMPIRSPIRMRSAIMEE